jgi:Methyltransferase domain
VAADFDDAWTAADAVPGWLTREQGEVLWHAAAAAGQGATIVEIGSHQGRSTVVLGRSARITGARVVAVDPFVDGRLFGGAATRTRFEHNVAAAGVAEVVRLIPERSTALRPSWSEPVAMVYVDGKHDFWTARDDLRWADRLPAGAPLLLHDAFSSVGVTLAVLVHVLPHRNLRYLGRTGSLARLTTGRPSTRDRLRIVGELAWFARNLLIKIGLRALRLLGRHRPDPY